MKLKYIHSIFAAIVLLLSIEYVSFGGGASVFRILVLPLSVLGLFFLKEMRISLSSKILLYFLTFYFAWIIGSNFLIGNTGDSITYILLLIFIFFLVKYFSSFPEKLNTIYKYTFWYALPHEIVYILLLAGMLPMSDYFVGYSLRFIGFHRDPNFMTIFISIAVLSKIQYLRFGNSPLYLKIITLCTLVLDIWLVTLGMSRGGIICLLGCFILQLISFIPGKSKKLLVAFILAAVMSSSYAFLKQFNEAPGDYQSQALNMVARFNRDDFSEGSGRVEIWKNNLHEILMFPVAPLGTNLENRPDEMYTHNTYIDILLTSGLIGGIVLIVILIIAQIQALIDIFKYGEEVSYLIIALVVVFQLFFLSLLTLKSTWVFFTLLLYNLFERSKISNTNH